MRTSHPHSVAGVTLLATLACAWASILTAQVAPKSYSEDLVLGLLGLGNVEILIGELPDGIEPRVPLPTDGTILGSFEDGASVKIVFESPGEPEAVASDYGSLLLANGWRTPEISIGDGLNASKREQRHRFVCSPGGDYAHFDTSAIDNHRSRVGVTVRRAPSGAGSYGLCADHGSRAPRESPEGPRLPPLYPPAEAAVYNSSSSSGPGFKEQSLQLETELSALELLVHYENQLTAAGWLAGDLLQGEVLLLESWVWADDQGVERSSYLQVFQAPGIRIKEVSIRTLVAGDHR